MNLALAARLREASVVLSESQLARYEACIGKLAEPSSASVPDQLARLRLAFAMQVTPDQQKRFDEQIINAGGEIDRRDDQMRRILAACVLVSRFNRSQGKRKRPSLAADSLAALGTRTLAASGREPVHPDVQSWADYWIENIAQDLRVGQNVPARPTVELEGAFDESTPPDQLAEILRGWMAQVDDYASELAAWSTELDPANIAAQDEQLGLLWWLESHRERKSPREAATEAALELARRARLVPGPPRADQLLARRLYEHRDENVVLGDLIENVDTRPPAELADLCPLLCRSNGVGERQVPTIEAARWLFDELLFVRLYGEVTSN